MTPMKTHWLIERVSCHDGHLLGIYLNVKTGVWGDAARATRFPKEQGADAYIEEWELNGKAEAIEHIFD